MPATPRDMTVGHFRITQAQPRDIGAIKNLFIEYSNSLGFGLEFQNFSSELATLPGEYAAPNGELLVAKAGRQVAGCVGLRKLDERTCEMKRLYVRPGFRGRDVGRNLVRSIVLRAKEMGYREMRLDTVPSMVEAQALYESLGFVEAPPYRDNPVRGVRFMKLDLTTFASQ